MLGDSNATCRKHTKGSPIIRMWGKILVAVFLLINYKALPLVYYVRFYTQLLKHVLIPYYKYGAKNPLIAKLQKDTHGVFSTTVLHTYNSLFETDMYMHKNNGTYFVDMDIARTELMSKIFVKSWMTCKKWPIVPVGSIHAIFKKEIKPLQKYTIESNILCWDEKWIYVICKFFIKNSKNEKILATYGLTKYVLKEGRKTIPPEGALEDCGLLNETVLEINNKNLDILIAQNGLIDSEKLIQLKHSYNYI